MNVRDALQKYKHIIDLTINGWVWIAVSIALAGLSRFWAPLGTTAQFIMYTVVALAIVFGRLKYVLLWSLLALVAAALYSPMLFAGWFAVFSILMLIRLSVFILMWLGKAIIDAVSRKVEEARNSYRRFAKIFLLMILYALEKRATMKYTAAVVLVLYINPLIMGLYAKFMLWIFEWSGADVSRPIILIMQLPFSAEEAARTVSAALAYALTYVFAAAALIWVSGALFVSLGKYKQRVRDEKDIAIMFAELFLIGGVIIHYCNILFIEGYHFSKMSWPGDNVLSWVDRPWVYFLAIIDSLFVSAVSISLLGISGIELNSAFAKIFYVGEAMLGLYILVLGVRKISDLKRTEGKSAAES